MDGSGATNISGMQASHHDMTAIPGGFATMLWNSSGIDAPNSLVERMDSATIEHGRHREPEHASTTRTATTRTRSTTTRRTTRYTLGDRNPNLYVKVSRTGQLIWQLGGTNPKDAAKMISGRRHLVGQPRTPPARRRHVRAVQQRRDDERRVGCRRCSRSTSTSMTATRRAHLLDERREQQRDGRRAVPPQRQHAGDVLAVGPDQRGHVDRPGPWRRTRARRSATPSYRESLYGPPPR